MPPPPFPFGSDAPVPARAQYHAVPASSPRSMSPFPTGARLTIFPRRNLGSHPRRSLYFHAETLVPYISTPEPRLPTCIHIPCVPMPKPRLPTSAPYISTPKPRLPTSALSIFLFLFKSVISIPLPEAIPGARSIAGISRTHPHIDHVSRRSGESSPRSR